MDEFDDRWGKRLLLGMLLILGAFLVLVLTAGRLFVPA